MRDVFIGAIAGALIAISFNAQNISTDVKRIADAMEKQAKNK